MWVLTAAGRLMIMTNSSAPPVRFGFVFPGGTAPQQIELAVLAEQAGWDGVFVWESAFGVDAWSLLSAMAVKTSHLRLGTLLTPLPWRRPWKVASQLFTLDQLAPGRAILSVGLGAVDDALGGTGEETDRRIRAALLDEGLDIIDALFAGQPRYDGAHYHVQAPDHAMLGSMVAARPQVWIVGLWDAPRSMRRVLRADGYLPNVAGGPMGEVLPHVADMRHWLDEHAPDGRTIELICEGQTPDDDPVVAGAMVAPFVAAGATWWIENRWGGDQHSHETLDAVRRRLVAGPPKPR
jgi:alkanesulfonate monooxygenase SsuD/methylene tetrahydromethanopterin reductase-like flavin-dependent oxidoreductase (luciferase family)